MGHFQHIGRCGADIILHRAIIIFTETEKYRFVFLIVLEQEPIHSEIINEIFMMQLYQSESYFWFKLFNKNQLRFSYWKTLILLQ